MNPASENSGDPATTCLALFLISSAFCPRAWIERGPASLVFVMRGEAAVRHHHHAGADNAVAGGVGVEAPGERVPACGRVGALSGECEGEAGEGVEHGGQTYSGQARLDLPAVCVNPIGSGRQSVESFWLC